MYICKLKQIHPARVALRLEVAELRRAVKLAWQRASRLGAHGGRRRHHGEHAPYAHEHIEHRIFSHPDQTVTILSPSVRVRVRVNPQVFDLRTLGDNIVIGLRVNPS